MTENAARKQQLIEFLNSIRRAGPPLDTGDVHRELIRSGVIESLGVVEVVAFLECRFGLNLAERGINPGELSTVANILNLIEAESARLAGVREA